MRQRRICLFLTIVNALILFPVGTQAADHPWQITSPDGKSSIAFGFLAQGQAEWLTNPKKNTTSQNLFLRRMRLIAGGQINEKISFFVESDSPNLGKAQADGTKVAERIFLQDVIFTYKFRDEFQLDGGMLLIPFSHNGTQGATTLLPVDYGPFSFPSADATDSRGGRDYGLQARGYAFKKHFEYRAGAFQGRRGTNANAPLRYAGRVVWYPFEAETGFFYSGTNLGTRKILALGASFDNQSDYHAQSLDVFYDQPLRHGDGLTLQADYAHLNGGRIFPQLLAEHTWLAEAGYYIHEAKIGPFMQLSGLRYRQEAVENQSKFLGGVAWWPQGHRINIKMGIGRIKQGSDPSSIQAQIQTQIYIY